MLKYGSRVYKNASAVSSKAKYYRSTNRTERAITLLRSAIKVWPENIFLYNQLLSCIKSTKKAWHIFEEIQKKGITADSYTYRALISIFHQKNKEKEIIAKLNPHNLPINVLPLYCEALRKNKQYQECIHWCNFVLSTSRNQRIREHAWINRLYCYLHTDGQNFLKDLIDPLVSPGSPYYHRLMAAKVYGGVYESPEIPIIREALVDARLGKIHEQAIANLDNALSMLS